MKSFTVRKIETDATGNIHLIGNKGTITIGRINDKYSAAHFSRSTIHGDVGPIHTCWVDEIPSPKKGQSTGGLAF